MKSIISVLFFLVIGMPLFSQVKSHKVIGKIVYDGKPLEGVKIKTLNSDITATTNENGNYEILVKPKDVLIFSHVGMHQETIIVEDVTTVLNLKMEEKSEQLDEVVLKKKVRTKKMSQRHEYKLNKNLFRSAFGYFDSEKTGLYVQTLNEEDIDPNAADILAIIRGRFPNTQVKYDEDQNPSVFIRGFASNLSGNVPAAIFDVDGAILEEVPFFINTNEIDRIAIISGQTAFARYGQRARGGVIIVNTKMANFVFEPGTENAYDYAKRRDNIYESANLEDVETIDSHLYLKDIKSARSFEDAKNIYVRIEKDYQRDPYFYLGMGEYFEAYWKENKFHDEIYNLVKEQFFENAEVLKALAYLYEKEGKDKQALELYGKVLFLRPDYMQSYRDLANMYLECGYTKSALRYYAVYNKKRNEDNEKNGIITEEIDSIVRLESANLVLKHGKELKVKKDMVKKHPGYLNSRVVLEWNNSQAEFDLQIINPKKHYFEWSHTTFKNEQLLLSEKIAGYSSKQFILDNYVTGLWQINIKYYGNKGLNPTYLKLTTYLNYGKPDQTKTVKVYKLFKEEAKMKLVAFNNRT